MRKTGNCKDIYKKIEVLFQFQSNVALQQDLKWCKIAISNLSPAPPCPNFPTSKNLIFNRFDNAFVHLLKNHSYELPRKYITSHLNWNGKLGSWKSMHIFQPSGTSLGNVVISSMKNGGSYVGKCVHFLANQIMQSNSIFLSCRLT